MVGSSSDTFGRRATLQQLGTDTTFPQLPLDRWRLVVRVRKTNGEPIPGAIVQIEGAPIADPESAEGLAILRAIAGKIGATRRPGAISDIPAGTTYLTQFVVHDLDFLTREGTAEESLLDLALIYRALALDSFDPLPSLRAADPRL